MNVPGFMDQHEIAAQARECFKAGHSVALVVPLNPAMPDADIGALVHDLSALVDAPIGLAVGADRQEQVPAFGSDGKQKGSTPE